MARDGSGVRATPNNTISITFMYRGERCRETIKLAPTKENLRRARLHKAAIEDSILKGSFDYSATFPNSKRIKKLQEEEKKQLVTVGGWLQTWLDRKSKQLHSSTIKNYRKIIDNQITPALGNYGLTELSRQIVRDWIERHQGTNKTIGNILSVLRSALTDAVDDGLIDTNPLVGWSYRKKSPQKSTRAKSKDPFTAAEQVAILNSIEGQGRNLIQFLFWTGLRTSEVVALQWGDIDFNSGTMQISRAKTQASKEPEAPKTKRGTRRVRLLKPALDALQNQKQHTMIAGKWVFHNPNTNAQWVGDQPIRRTLWIPVLKRAGVRYRNPYQTRHTYASMMISSGEPIGWISKQLGHNNISMTLSAYADWLDDAAPSAGGRAVDLFAPKSCKTYS